MAGRFSVEAVFKAIDEITAPVSKMSRSIGRMTRKAEKDLRGLSRTADKFTGSLKSAGAVASVGVAAVAGAVTLLMGEFSKVEDAEAAFTPILGGADRARKLVDELNNTAASTPFQFENLAGAASQLLPVMNGDIENTIRTMRMLGDTAGGNAQKLDSITRGYTKAMLKGKVDMESLNMIAEAGVPIFQDLADVMGMKTGEKFFKTISSGKVTTDQLTKAFEKLTGEGGKFFQGMEIASRTTSGLWSTFKDNISLTAAELGGAIAPVVKDVIVQMTELAKRIRVLVGENRELIAQKVGDFFKFITENAGGILKTIKYVGIAIGVLLTLVTILKIVIGVMTVVNLVMSLNPIGLIVIGVAALIAGFTALVVWIDDVVAGFDSMPVVIQAILAPIEILVRAIKFVKDSIAFIAKGGIGSFIFDLINGSGDNQAAQTPQTYMVTPQDRTARTTEETRQTSTAEVTIRDETGRAEIRQHGVPGNATIKMASTGAF